VAGSVLALLAVRARERAIEESQLSRSRELAATANAQLLADPELGALLASRAYDVRRTPQALDALEHALVDLHLRATVPGRNPQLAPGWKLLVLDRGAARVWSWRTGRLVATFRAPDGQVTSAQLDDSGKFLVTGSDVGVVRVWRIGEASRRGEFEAEPGGARAVAFDPSVMHVATGGKSTVRVWDWRSGLVVAAFRGPLATRNVSFEGNGRLLLAAGPSGVRVWDWRKRKRLLAVAVPSNPSDHPELSRDGRALLLEDSSNALVYRLSRAQPSEFAGTLSVTDADFSRDGREIVLGDLAGGAAVWDWKEHRVLARLPGQSTTRAVASGQRGIVAVAGEDGAVALWAPPATQQLAELRGHRSPVTKIKFGGAGAIATSGAGRHRASLGGTRAAGPPRTFSEGAPAERRGDRSSRHRHRRKGARASARSQSPLCHRGALSGLPRT
jgi:WD40 repeat protein